MAHHRRRSAAAFAFAFLAVPLFGVLLLGEVWARVRWDHPTPEALRSRSLRYVPAVFARHVFPRELQRIEGKAWTISERGYRGPALWSMRRTLGSVVTLSSSSGVNQRTS